MQISKRSVLLLGLILLVACSPVSSPTDSPLEAIKEFSVLAGFRESDLSFVETTTMGNSPNGNLLVDLYQDEEGRRFYIEPITNTVVEMDARTLLPSHGESPEGTQMEAAELEQRAVSFIHAALPQFSSLQGDLTCEMGNKGANYFFDWRMKTTEVNFMPPFIQVAMTTSGDMFGYINTVTLP